MNLRFIEGDVRKPDAYGHAYIFQVVNDIGVMGGGVALAIMQKWPRVKETYLSKNNGSVGKSNGLRQGDYHLVKVEDKITVVNLVGQSCVGPTYGLQPVRYEALREALMRFREEVLKKEIHSRLGCSLHAPRIGCGLAGGDWRMVEGIIQNVLGGVEVDFTIYDWASPNTQTVERSNLSRDLSYLDKIQKPRNSY